MTFVQVKQKKFEILDRNTVLTGLLNIIAASQTEHQVKQNILKIKINNLDIFIEIKIKFTLDKRKLRMSLGKKDGQGQSMGNQLF